MKIRQTWLSACAVVTLIAGTAACTSDGPEPAAKPTRAAADAADTAAADTACANGTYAWFNVDKRDVLTGVAEKQKLGKGGGKLTNKLELLHTPRVTVTFEKGPRVRAEAVLRSLGIQIGETDGADGVVDEFADVRFYPHRLSPRAAPASTAPERSWTTPM